MVWITVNTDVNISGNYKIHQFLKHFWRSNPWNLRGSRAAAHAAVGTQETMLELGKTLCQDSPMCQSTKQRKSPCAAPGSPFGAIVRTCSGACRTNKHRSPKLTTQFTSVHSFCTGCHPRKQMKLSIHTRVPICMRKHYPRNFIHKHLTKAK